MQSPVLVANVNRNYLSPIDVILFYLLYFTEHLSFTFIQPLLSYLSWSLRWTNKSDMCKCQMLFQTPPPDPMQMDFSYWRAVTSNGPSWTTSFQVTSFHFRINLFSLDNSRNENIFLHYITVVQNCGTINILPWKIHWFHTTCFSMTWKTTIAAFGWLSWLHRNIFMHGTGCTFVTLPFTDCAEHACPSSHMEICLLLL
jgi:hypothetical protein